MGSLKLKGQRRPAEDREAKDGHSSRMRKQSNTLIKKLYHFAVELKRSNDTVGKQETETFMVIVSGPSL